MKKSFVKVWVSLWTKGGVEGAGGYNWELLQQTWQSSIFKQDQPMFLFGVYHLALKLTKKSTSTEENLNLISISKFWLVHWTFKTMCTRFNSHSHCFSQVTSAHSKGTRGRGGNNRQQYLSWKTDSCVQRGGGICAMPKRKGVLLRFLP